MPCCHTSNVIIYHLFFASLARLSTCMTQLMCMFIYLQVGFLFDRTQSWEMALFLPSAFFMMLGTLVYNVYGRNHPINFDAMDNSPFWFEKWLPKLPSFSKKQE